MHYLYRYVCILNVFFYMCIWTIVCNKELIIWFVYKKKTIDSLIIFYIVKCKKALYYLNNNSINFSFVDIQP